MKLPLQSKFRKPTIILVLKIHPNFLGYDHIESTKVLRFLPFMFLVKKRHRGLSLRTPNAEPEFEFPQINHRVSFLSVEK